jgi:hypothetical protein
MLSNILIALITIVELNDQLKQDKDKYSYS